MVAMGKGGHESADSCRMGEVRSVGMVELLYVGRLLRIVRGFVGGGETL